MNRAITIAAGLMLAGAMATSAGAAGLLGQGGYGGSTYNSAAYNWEGFYAGIYGGAWPGSGGAGTIGGMAGLNFAINDMLIAGGELQVGKSWPSGGDETSVLALGRLGVAVSDAVMLYGEGGFGTQDGNGTYALGAGLELAMTDNIALRGDILALSNNGGLNGARVTAGALWYFN
ncbi:MAG TPA: hypothetical protein VIL84_14905 [Devosiaceae bacterium]